MPHAPAAPVVAPQEEYGLINDPDEITHLVCCRDVSWRVAFCGAEETAVNPGATVVCTMCLEEAQALRPGFDQEDPPICPIDGNSCPSPAEVDELIARRTAPPQRSSE